MDGAAPYGDGRLKMISIIRTSEETSVVSEAAEEDTEAAWRCIRIAGPMAFGSWLFMNTICGDRPVTDNSFDAIDVVGVMSNFTTPLRDAGVGVFVVSTW